MDRKNNIMKRARLAKAMTMQEMADKLGLHKSSINEYEAGRRIPSVMLGVRMAQAYGLPISKLVLHFEKMNK